MKYKNTNEEIINNLDELSIIYYDMEETIRLQKKDIHRAEIYRAYQIALKHAINLLKGFDCAKSGA